MSFQGIAQQKDDNPIGRPGDLTALTFRGSFCGPGLPGGGGSPEELASVSWRTIVPAEETTLLKVLTYFTITPLKNSTKSKKNRSMAEV